MSDNNEQDSVTQVIWNWTLFAAALVGLWMAWRHVVQRYRALT